MLVCKYCICCNRTKKNISDWSLDRVRLLRARAEHISDLARSVQEKSRVLYPEAEDRCFMNFYIRRNKIGLKTGDRWLMYEMLDILAVLKPKGWQTFCASFGWLNGFKKRYRITSQVRTNKKHCPIEQRLPEIAEFHRNLRVLRLSGNACPRYGRFVASSYFHVDQVFRLFIVLYVYLENSFFLFSDLLTLFMQV